MPFRFLYRLAFAILTASCCSAQTTTQAALTAALKGTPAVGIVIDLHSGRQLAVVRADEAANERSSPGSILKPLFLNAALQQHEILPQTSVFCRRSLQINDGTRMWNVDCSHPRTGAPFSAQEALAYFLQPLLCRISRPHPTLAGDCHPRTVRAASAQPTPDPATKGTAGLRPGRDHGFSPTDRARLSYAGSAVAGSGTGRIARLRNLTAWRTTPPSQACRSPARPAPLTMDGSSVSANRSSLSSTFPTATAPMMPVSPNTFLPLPRRAHATSRSSSSPRKL